VSVCEKTVGNGMFIRIANGKIVKEIELWIGERNVRKNLWNLKDSLQARYLAKAMAKKRMDW
jgi:hypothetical protein